MLELILRALRWRWPIMLAVLLPVAIVGIGAVESRAEPVQAISVVGVTPERADSASSDMVQLTTSRYAVVLGSEETMNAVASATGVSAADLSSAVSITPEADTGNLQISVMLPTEDQALSVANSLAEQAIVLGNDDAFMDASVLAAAQIQAPALTASPRLLEAVLLLAAILAALALGYALEVVRPRIRTGGDAADVTGAPIIGSLPSFVGPWPKKAVVADEVVLQAARAMRGGFAASGRDVPAGASTCVVGAEPGSGSTTVAFLLARSMSDRGESVLLVDVDFESAGLSTRLGIPDEFGLDDVLLERAPLADAVHHEGEVAIVGTHTMRGAADVLDRRLPDVLKVAADGYETVLLDTPDLLTGDGAEVVAGEAASVVLVVRLGTIRSQVADVVHRLDRLDITIRGVVLNHASRALAEGAAAPLTPTTSTDG